MLPAFVAGEPSLAHWDIHCVGYPTSLCPDITGVWSADPSLVALSDYFTRMMRDGLQVYEKLSIVAHSMGGLIVQRALLDCGCVDRVAHVMLFATPSAGLQKARLTRIFKRQIKDMSPGSEFIRELRQKWNADFERPKFDFRVIAGLSDDFVPSKSSLDPFDPQFHDRVMGNHSEMVKPAMRDSDSARLVIETLQGKARAAARLKVSAMIEGSVADSSPREIVDRALALELAGMPDQAIRLLEQNVQLDPDIVGVLAGRLKRRWLSDADENHEDGRRARELYQLGYERALEERSPLAAAYNAINAAFMELAFGEDRDNAKEFAKYAIDQTSLDPDPTRGQATIGEACLLLGRDEEAVVAYLKARSRLDVRQRGAMYRQAIWTARLLQNDMMEARLLAQMFERNP